MKGEISIVTPDANSGYLVFSSPSRSGTYNAIIYSKYGGGSEYLAMNTYQGGEVMRLTHQGRVGIGTTTPYGKLEVAQATAFTTVYNASVDNIVLTRDATTGSGNYGGSIGFSPIDSPNERMAVIASVQTAADTNQMGLALFTHPSSTGGDAIVEAMRIKHDGYVGIGTASPKSLLHLPLLSHQHQYKQYQKNETLPQHLIQPTPQNLIWLAA